LFASDKTIISNFSQSHHKIISLLGLGIKMENKSIISFSEIEQLKQYFKDFSIKIKVLSYNESHDALWVKLKINKQFWEIYVDDEYKDFNPQKPILGFYLILSSLETYKDSPDFLVWAKENHINISEPKWKWYYSSLEKTYLEIEKLLGRINSHVSCFDYNMHTALGLALIKLED